MAPFPVVLVELENKQRLSAQLTDYQADDLTSGKKVIIVLRKTRKTAPEEVIVYGICFKPI